MCTGHAVEVQGHALLRAGAEDDSDIVAALGAGHVVLPGQGGVRPHILQDDGLVLGCVLHLVPVHAPLALCWLLPVRRRFGVVNELLAVRVLLGVEQVIRLGAEAQADDLGDLCLRHLECYGLTSGLRGG